MSRETRKNIMLILNCINEHELYCLCKELNILPREITTYLKRSRSGHQVIYKHCNGVSLGIGEFPSLLEAHKYAAIRALLYPECYDDGKPNGKVL